MFLSILARIPQAHPFKFGCAFSCVKTAFSDCLVQTQVEKREHIDWRRNLTFASFGLVYLGGVQYAIYVPLFSRLFPNAAKFAAAPLREKMRDPVGCRNLISQVILDQFVHHPFLYFPAFYCLKEVVNGGAVSQGLVKYSNNYQEDLVALWKLWVPSTIINFAFMPMHLRIPWVATTSLVWTCILSAMRGNNDMETRPEEAMNYVGGNQGRTLLALYDLGISTKPAYFYDKSKTHKIVTASGHDRIGFIHAVSESVMTHGGNILDLKAYKVGREFVTVMLVEVEPTEDMQMTNALKLLGDAGMQVNVQATQPWVADDALRFKEGVAFTGHLRVTGPDKPGLILGITKLLADERLDIMSLSCNQHFQNVLGTHDLQQLAQITGVVRAFNPIDMAQLNRKLIMFEQEYGVRVGITETDPAPTYSPLAEVHAEKKGIARRISEYKG